MIKSRTVRTRITIVALALLTISGLSGYVDAQTLARPGWVGSGLTAQSWFKRAIFYEIDVRTFQDSNGDGTGDLKGIAERLDYIHSLGADAILLEPLGRDQRAVQTGSQSRPIDPVIDPVIDPALGSLDDLDDLTLQASRLKIRVLIELTTPDPALVRFWLNRGIAGFYVPGDVSASAAALQSIRKLLPTAVGQRVLITDADLSAPTAPRPSSNELVLYRANGKAATLGSSVTELRSALDQSQALGRTGTPIFAGGMPTTSSANPDMGFARISLAVVLLNRSAALITAGQELGLTSPDSKTAPMPWGLPPAVAAEEAAKPVPEPAKPAPPIAAAAPEQYTPYVRPAAPKKIVPPDPASAAGQDANPGSLLNFYRRLSLLHHGGSAIHDGEQITLDHDGQNALIWVRRPASPSLANPAVVVACNLSDRPIVLSLRADMTRLQLRGTFLRTLVRSDDAMGGTSIDPLTVPAYGVYVGELRR